MRDRKAAVRFARAFFDEARSRGAIDQAASDLTALRDIWAQTPELVEVLSQPLVPEGRKRQICRAHLGAHVQPEQMRFLDLLIAHQRVALLPDIVEQFRSLVDDHHGIVRAQVRSAVPLTEEEEARLQAALAALFGGQPVVDISVHPELVGGVTVRVKDSVIDGSVRTSLNVLRTELQAVTIDKRGTAEGSGD